LWNSEDVVKTVARTLLMAAPLLIGVAARAAQAPSPRPAVVVSELRAKPFVDPARSPGAVLQRLLSLDANADGRLSRDELPERMQRLFVDGDKNANGFLESTEIRLLVDAAGLERARVAFKPQPSEGLPGVISDLKLSQAKHLRALEIVGTQNPPRHANDPNSSALLKEMKALLDQEEYENFVAAATRLSRGPQIRLRTFDGPVRSLVIRQ